MLTFAETMLMNIFVHIFLQFTLCWCMYLTVVREARTDCDRDAHVFVIINIDHLFGVYGDAMLSRQRDPDSGPMEEAYPSTRASKLEGGAVLNIRPSSQPVCPGRPI